MAGMFRGLVSHFGSLSLRTTTLRTSFIPLRFSSNTTSTSTTATNLTSSITSSSQQNVSKPKIQQQLFFKISLRRSSIGNSLLISNDFLILFYHFLDSYLILYIFFFSFYFLLQKKANFLKN